MVGKRKRIRAERLTAFEHVVKTYEQQLIRYVARILCDPNTAQDVVQDTFIKLLKKWREPFAPGPKVSSWLYRVAHNEAVDVVRKTSRRQNLHRRQAEREDAFVLPDRGAGFRVSDEAVDAGAALAILSPREQQIVMLKVYEEKSYREIGEIMGLKVGNVGYILHHAMKKLAAELRSSQT